MKHLILTLTILVVLGSAPFAYPDPGEPDTVKITGGPLVVGQSVPVYLTIVNDEDIQGYGCGLLLEETLGGFAVFDSVVYLNRLADPSVISLRYARYWINGSEGGVSPDTLAIAGYKILGNPLPPGNDSIIAIYLTGTSVGTMHIDSTFFAPAGDFALTYTSQDIFPQFVDLNLQVIDASEPPTLAIDDEIITIIAGSTAETEVTFSSPENYPLNINILSMHAYDDESSNPTNQPSIGGGNPAQFSWQSTSSDIGIWLAEIQVCDSSGACTTGEIIIQVVESGDFLISFAQDSMVSNCASSGIGHGDFDMDNYPEVITCGAGPYVTHLMELYDFSQSSWDLDYSRDADGFARMRPINGYFNLDSYLDIIVMKYISDQGYLETYMGDGDNSFTVGGESNDGTHSKNQVVGEFTRDSHVDIATSFNDGIRIYAGNSQGDFTEVNYIDPGQSVLTLNTADFNEDGYDDLAVGLTDGIQIYLGTNTGDFSTGNFYSQVYGTVEIEVTNQGSDFNNDNHFDLCISTPSVGGAESQLVLYLGNGDGTFTQVVTRTVQGQIFGNTVCDINLDGYLDIAYVNGAREYVAVLFGDGDGGFTNEMRYAIDHVNPQFIDACDFDLDGDIDLVVAANQFPHDFALFFLENQLDPGGFFNNSISLDARDNAKLEIISPTDRVLNQIRNTIPASELYRCNLDNNDMLDEKASLGLVESGCYHIKVQPKSSNKSDETFSLEYELNDIQYRLVGDLPMSPEGYEFQIYPDGNWQVGPRSGQFTGVNPPTLSWAGEGQYDYQFASDIEFENIIQSGSVDINRVSLAEPLEDTDSTAYYWRIKPAGAGDYECLYVLNMVSGYSGNCGDANGDSFINISDAVYIVNYVFLGGEAPEPLSVADVNCDTKTNISDAVYLILYVFANGNDPCDTNGDTIPDC